MLSTGTRHLRCPALLVIALVAAVASAPLSDGEGERAAGRVVVQQVDPEADMLPLTQSLMLLDLRLRWIL